MEAAEILDEVGRQVRICQRCQLHLSRKNAVPGEGPATAQVMLIGEGPGFHENEQGRPFVGAAGKFLSELLEKAGLKRNEVYITNVVKCRPPSNRDPLPEELAACGDFLEQQIQAIKPLIIITLGRFSMARFIPNVKISAVHGQARWINDQLVVPMFHPAAALHQPALKSSVENDFAQLPQMIAQARKRLAAKAGAPIVEQQVQLATKQPEVEKAPPEPPATQLSLV